MEVIDTYQQDDHRQVHKLSALQERVGEPIEPVRGQSPREIDCCQKMTAGDYKDMVPRMHHQHAKDHVVELIVHAVICTLPLTIKVWLLYLMSTKRETLDW